MKSKKLEILTFLERILERFDKYQFIFDLRWKILQYKWKLMNEIYPDIWNTWTW